MRDEAAFLRREVARIREEHGDELAHQVECYRMRQGRFNDIHRERLAKLAKVPGFSGSLQPGTAVDKQRTRGGVAPPAAESSAAASPTGAEGEDSDAEEDEEEMLGTEFLLLSVAQDSRAAQAEALELGDAA
ncbi:hypothetical protein B0H15DRAFT_958297 [Mycena belliarum]|uniref:Uncharacterized protein n=1 Tax=Mycena belliarum TaxID=1033014 RepID=A0AAD6XKQ9_9AGAR|nr:hypothetical protein B0H15DRAFT_958297 [Mycena belliae]